MHTGSTASWTGAVRVLLRLGLAGQDLGGAGCISPCASLYCVRPYWHCFGSTVAERNGASCAKIDFLLYPHCGEFSEWPTAYPPRPVQSATGHLGQTSLHTLATTALAENKLQHYKGTINSCVLPMVSLLSQSSRPKGKACSDSSQHEVWSKVSISLV